MTKQRRLPRRAFLGTTAGAFILARFGAGCAPSGLMPEVSDTGDVVQALDGLAALGADVTLPAGPFSDPLTPLTSNEAFYTVSAGSTPKAGWDVDWALALTGLGEEITLDLETLQAFGSETVEHTLECIGNGPPGKALGNAKWTGIRLRDLLTQLDRSVPQQVAWLGFECGDDYTTFIPFDDEALDLVLVWRMNGEPLALAHGAPLRALVPGRYGMKNPKWLTRINFSVTEPEGFWEAYGWSTEARYRVHSWMKQPTAGSTVPAAGVTLLGSAHAGAVPIARVELSTDGGDTWTDAELTYVGPPNAWSLWRYRWTPGTPGAYTLVVRATDAEGRVQGPSDGSGNLAGWQGHHTLIVEAG
jgi:DMSO/TMAO reductase YedYZ molybdopterin-dependent catalytic subunit